ncbi:MAG: hypothetical protein HYV27_10985 [Candidatus Hydrogenedentes bacterium]|nr:hypothetical protein [Candidatus Hydrogenedentota bacterium]
MSAGIILIVLLAGLGEHSAPPLKEAQETDFIEVAFEETSTLPQTAPAPVPEFKAPKLAMEDQFGASVTLAFPQEEPHVLFATDRKGVDDTIRWYKAFEKRYGKTIPSYGLAQGKNIPAILHPLVKRIIRKDVPQSVFLDWKNSQAEAWQFQSGQANMYVIAPDGAVVFHGIGAMTDAKRDAFFAVLDRYAAEASTSVPKE